MNEVKRADRVPDDLPPDAYDKYLDYIQWSLYGRYVNPQTLVADREAEYGHQNACAIADLIDRLHINFNDPAYRSFTLRVARLVADGYSYEATLATDIAVAAFRDVLICRGRVGLPYDMIHVERVADPVYNGDASLLYLTDPSRSPGEQFLCEQFTGNEDPAAPNSVPAQVVMTRLTHISEEQARFTALFRERVCTPDAQVSDPSIVFGMHLVEVYDWGQFHPRELRITASVAQNPDEHGGVLSSC